MKKYEIGDEIKISGKWYEVLVDAKTYPYISVGKMITPVIPEFIEGHRRLKPKVGEVWEDENGLHIIVGHMIRKRGKDVGEKKLNPHWNIKDNRSIGYDNISLEKQHNIRKLADNIEEYFKTS